MYLKPGNLYKTFTIDTKKTEINTAGRAKATYNAKNTFNGILADAKPEEKERYKQLTHPITHTITHKGSPKLKEEDKVSYNGRKFYVQGVDDPAAIGLWTIYYVEERA